MAGTPQGNAKIPEEFAEGERAVHDQGGTA